MSATTTNSNNTTTGSTLLKDLAPGVPERIKESLKKDPMAILPINLFCSALDIKDPLTVIKEFEPDKEDIGIMVNAFIGVVPVVGPILQGVFSLFWKRAAESNNVTKEELKKELDKLKKEMMEAVKGKIKESEAKQWAEICDAFLSGLKKSFKVLTININALKHQFSQTQSATEQVQEAVRTTLEMVRDKSMSLHEFCGSQDYLSVTLPYYVQSLQIYTIVMTIMDSFWYQIGIDPIYVAGQPATDTIDEVPSFRKRMHDEIVPAITNIGKCIDLDETVGMDRSDIHLLLKNDRYLYPIPLIEAPINIPSKVKLHSEINQVRTPYITLPDRKCPYIYRIDCINFRPDPRSEFTKGGYRKMAQYNESVTGCKGDTSGSDSTLTVKLPEKKNVQIRVMGQYSDCVEHLPMSFNTNSEYTELAKTYPAIQEKIGVSGNTDEIHSGLTYIDEVEEVDEITFTIESFSQSFTEEPIHSRIFYVELIIRDLSQDQLDQEEDN